MFYNKYPHPANFSFVTAASVESDGNGLAASFTVQTANQARTLEAMSRITSYTAGIHHLTLRSVLWPENHSQAELDFGASPAAEAAGEAGSSLRLSDGFQLQLVDGHGTAILQTAPDGGFGVSGEQSILRFQIEAEDRFYGMGEKWFGRLELSGIQTKYWNTDVWGDFDIPTCVSGRPDPVYASIPYLILRRGDRFIGMLVNNPGAVFMRTGAVPSDEWGIQRAPDDGTFVIGSESGPLDVVFMDGPTLPELTRKYQRLVGTTPVPPVWALGYHQCRWGYGSRTDLEWLNSNLDAHSIPCDGIWLDIDYMDGYRVFTFEAGSFPAPAEDIAAAQASGRRVVPILDPGVKRDTDYSVFESGREADAFCRNPQGEPFVGLVWPGETVFPDFSVERGRRWWRDQVAAFAAAGFHGAWVDMNDPSTGSVLATDMLFDAGTRSHETYHNQYGLGMAAATRAGFEDAHPNERPFLLCRSAFTGSGRLTALWTGDNYSNYHHLESVIPTTLNLALSGIPFNGPDVGGFGGDTWEQLLIDWTKACFLFPFFRNHSTAGTRNQEPWSLGKRVLEVTRSFIQLRYRFRPYLYNLFVRHAETGDAILRPIIYDYPNDRRFDAVADQFMVGPDLLHAPFVSELSERIVELPEGRWYAMDTGKWIEGGGAVTRHKADSRTPLFVRDGAIIPWSSAPAGENRWDGGKVQFLVFVSEPGAARRADDPPRAEARYVWDDGISLGYTRGERSAVHITAELRVGEAGPRLSLSIRHDQTGYGTLSPTVAVIGEWEEIDLLVDGEPVASAQVRAQVEINGYTHMVNQVTPVS